MKTFLILILSFMVYSCSNSKHVGSKKVSKVDERTAASSGLICKNELVAGSRRHVRVCLTKEQRELNRLESQRAIKNANDGRSKTKF